MHIAQGACLSPTTDLVPLFKLTSPRASSGASGELHVIFNYFVKKKRVKNTRMKLNHLFNTPN